MRFFKILFILLCVHSGAEAQYTRYVIQLADKQNNIYNIKNPSQFLSNESIERRIKQNILIDSTDLPVSKTYIDSIKSIGNVTILNQSKWLNQILISTNDPIALDKISKLPFVLKTLPIAKKTNKSIFSGAQGSTFLIPTWKKYAANINISNSINYGSSLPQISIHEGEFIHNLGFTGKGMKVAVLDAGFYKYQNLNAFDSLRAGNQILGTWDFVENGPSVNEDDSHGMMCLSILSANLPGNFVGTAPKASYYLFRTEDIASEYPVEEQNWAAGAERADSLGVDLITSSLGYSQFDDPTFNHVYADMDGTKTIVSRAATFAVKKGMIVTNSAGNEGAKAWKYILAPADVDNVLSIGAININKQVASFSSYGPAANKNTKPDVTSVGWNTVLINTSGTVGSGNGTSFSNPNLAGLITCLWQAFPEFSNLEIINAVRKSADHFSAPDNRTGYGIPNMRLAYKSLEIERNIRKAQSILKNDIIKFFPNPIQEKATVLYKAEADGYLLLKIFTFDGKLIKMYNFPTASGNYHYFDLGDLSSLQHGTHLVQYDDGKSKGIIQLLK